MPDIRTAKLFKIGADQAVWLPDDWRFDGEEVYIRRDERTDRPMNVASSERDVLADS